MSLSRFILLSLTALRSATGSLSGLANPVNYGSGVEWAKGLVGDFNATSLQLGIVLCHVELYCILMHYIVLCCIVLYCIVLYCIVLYCIVLYCIVLYCVVLYCIILYCIVLYCIVLYCIVLYCTILSLFISIILP